MLIESRLHVGAAALFACCAGLANAEQLNIDEPGFEADGTWKLGQTGGGVDGFFDDAHGRYIEAGLIDPVPNRDLHFAYNNGRQHDIYQVLEATVQANTTYTLSIVAIDPAFSNPFPGGELRLGYVSERAAEDAEESNDDEAKGNDDYGLNLFKPTKVDKPVPFNDTENDLGNKTDGYATWTYTFTTGENPRGLGQSLRIEVLGGGKTQSIFDNVSLTATASADEVDVDQEALGKETTPPTVVMFGDSVTEQGLAQQVEKIFDEEGRQPVFINAGKGYDNATSALDRLNKDVLAHRPNVVTICFGLNDTGGRKPKQFKDSLEQMIKTLGQADIDVALITSTPFDNARHGWGKDEDFQTLGGLDQYMDRAFCQTVRDLAKEHELVLIDLHTHFTDAFKKDPKLIKLVISNDGVHLTAKGKSMAAQRIAEVITAQFVGR